jgi:holliday junction DNA helicase RuvB
VSTTPGSRDAQGVGPGAMLSREAAPDDVTYERQLRPQSFDEYVGQEQAVASLRVSVEAARLRRECVDHVLLYGPPGLGKTTLAGILANEMGTSLVTTSGPAIERGGDMMGILTNLGENDVLFIDEVHRLPRPVEELLYPAMEDFAVNFVIEKGLHARTLKYNLRPFTLVAATTRPGMLSAPLRERFGIFHHLDFYSETELARIVRRSAAILDARIDGSGADEIARRSRGTPRIVNRLLRRVRDYAQVSGGGVITAAIARDSLDREGVDRRGLDRLDRRFLEAIIDQYGGGPVGLEAVAATINDDAETLAGMVEPYLLKIGFIVRAPRGRRATPEAYTHLGRALPPTALRPTAPPDQAKLFE